MPGAQVAGAVQRGGCCSLAEASPPASLFPPCRPRSLPEGNVCLPQGRNWRTWSRQGSHKAVSHPVLSLPVSPFPVCRGWTHWEATAAPAGVTVCWLLSHAQRGGSQRASGVQSTHPTCSVKPWPPMMPRMPEASLRCLHQGLPSLTYDLMRDVSPARSGDILRSPGQTVKPISKGDGAVTPKGSSKPNGFMIFSVG